MSEQRQRKVRSRKSIQKGGAVTVEPRKKIHTKIVKEQEREEARERRERKRMVNLEYKLQLRAGIDARRAERGVIIDPDIERRRQKEVEEKEEQLHRQLAAEESGFVDFADLDYDMIHSASDSPQHSQKSVPASLLGPTPFEQWRSLTRPENRQRVCKLCDHQWLAREEGYVVDFRTVQEKGTRGGVLAAANTHVADVKTRGTHRAHFLNELVKLIPDEVPEFGKRLKNIEESGDKMVMTFEDGTTAEADAVIGCDGIKSRTLDALAVDALGDELAKNSQMYMGEHGHVFIFPIGKGKTRNVVAFRTKPDGKWED
ncbi:hypothetical protein GMDG_01754 [Pseudogymnoascus destructans 20631-21]|uniref:FAD-binding domain-containing protein n=1 Tax=Pseudogymnoascus destructans (strain ATCC MYA-4855 / 20631-21) TaxID=658429 RepID=L8FY24_PSED2|nr:hypothetical protein GMDG_01754 [Pseudogymnoascus destructans 20631-21]